MNISDDLNDKHYVLITIPYSPDSNSLLYPALVDSGVSKHFAPFKRLFSSFKDIQLLPFHIAGGPDSQALDRSDVTIRLLNIYKYTKVTLHNVLYIPNMSIALISAYCLDKVGYIYNSYVTWKMYNHTV